MVSEATAKIFAGRLRKSTYHCVGKGIKAMVASLQICLPVTFMKGEAGTKRCKVTQESVYIALNSNKSPSRSPSLC